MRGGHKGHKSRVIIKVKGILEGFDETRTEELLDQLQNHRQTLTEKLETLKVLDEAIVELVKDKEIDAEIEESENFKFGIHDTIRKIDSKLKRLKKSEANAGDIASAQAEGAISSYLQVRELSVFASGGGGGIGGKWGDHMKIFPSIGGS